MTGAVLEKPALGKLGLTFFFVIMTLGLGFQTFLELVMMGLGSGIAPASSAIVSVPMAAGPSLLLLFSGLIYFKGIRLTLRVLGYAASLHGLLCGWLWITLSTPIEPIYHPYHPGWVNDHPDLAGLCLMLASLALWLALFATSPALPAELKRLTGFR